MYVVLKINKFFLLVFIFFFSFAVFFYSDAVKLGVSNGISLCLNILIPSLFPFMFISSLVVQSNIFDNPSRVSKYISGKFLRLPACCISVIILSLIGGYPTAANSIKNLIKQGKINKNQAERMTYFCVSAGPAYVVNVVGVGVFSSFKLGVILFLAQLFSFFIIIILFNLNSNNFNLANNHIVESSYKSFSELVVDSCKDCVLSMLNVCSFVMLFSAFIAIVDSCNIINLAVKLLQLSKASEAVLFSAISCMIEISTGTSIAANYGLSPSFFSFFLGFGGVCVFFQIFSLLRGIRINKLKFIVARFLQAVLAMLFSYILIKVFPCEVSTISIERSTMSSNSVHGSLALVFMSFVFLISLFSQGQNKLHYAFDKRVNNI